MDRELAPMDKGMLAGQEYAIRTGGDHAKLRPVVKSWSAAEIHSAVDWDLIGPIEKEQPVEFWSGFAHGVRQFLVDEAATLSKDPPGAPRDAGQPASRG